MGIKYKKVLSLMLYLSFVILAACFSAYRGYIGGQQKENTLLRLSIQTKNYVDILENQKSLAVKEIVKYPLLDTLYQAINRIQNNDLISDEYHINEYKKQVFYSIVSNSEIRAYLLDESNPKYEVYDHFQNFVKQNLDDFVKDVVPLIEKNDQVATNMVLTL